MTDRGRPTDYERKFARQAKQLCELGATDADIAEFFGVSDRTIYRWRIEFPDFCQALKSGKEAADDRVERSLYHRAVGYSHPAVKIFLPKDSTEPVYADYREHYPPDTGACTMWLKNRRGDVWRDKTVNEHTGKDGAPLLPPAPEMSKAECAALIAEIIQERLASKGESNGG